MAVSEGADFPPSVLRRAKELAAFKCCLCHSRAGDEVHHVLPKAEGGTNDLGNAVLLCSQCHTDNGSRPERRRFIREARDWWYARVRERYSSEQIGTLVQIDQLVTKADFDGMQHALIATVKTLIDSVRAGSTNATEVVNAASTMVSSLSSPPAYLGSHLVVQAPRCSQCGEVLGLGPSGYECANCKHRSQ
jgi:hypothetical protein